MPGYTPLYSVEYPVNADPVWKAAGTIERLARSIESKIAGGVGAAVNADPNTVVRRDASASASRGSCSASCPAWGGFFGTGAEGSRT